MTTLHFARLESWALSVIARVESGASVEDARVELKREWIDAAKAARRLAGHANAARGTEILWIIGLDEDAGLIGANPQELADWWSRIQSCFDGMAPALTDLVIHKDAKTVCALVFSTTRAPYVIKNPLFGSANAGPIALEVPWREGTRVRTATRNDLLLVLTPRASLPHIEALNGRGSMRVRANSPNREMLCATLSFSIWLYLTPRGDEPTVIPFHRCECVAEGSRFGERIEGFDVKLNRPWQYGAPGRSRPDSVTMERTSSEIIANGPGKCELMAEIEFADVPVWLRESPLQLSFTLPVVDAEAPIVLRALAIPVKVSGDELAHWTVTPCD